jgi:hypothetical protein
MRYYRGGFSRRTTLTTSSNFDRNRDRSFGVIGGGPPVTAPPCRNPSIRSRIANAALVLGRERKASVHALFYIEEVVRLSAVSDWALRAAFQLWRGAGRLTLPHSATR